MKTNELQNVCRLIRRGESKKATKILEELIEDYPEVNELYAVVCKLRICQDKSGIPLNWAKKAIEAKGNLLSQEECVLLKCQLREEAEVYAKVGWFNYMKENYSHAASCFIEVLNLGAESAQVYLDLRLAYQDFKKKNLFNNGRVKQFMRRFEEKQISYERRA